MAKLLPAYVYRSHVYGSWRDGSDIKKGRNGYFVIHWNPRTDSDDKHYISWRPKPVASKKLM